jgi:hypothetical protein
MRSRAQVLAGAEAVEVLDSDLAGVDDELSPELELDAAGFSLDDLPASPFSLGDLLESPFDPAAAFRLSVL